MFRSVALKSFALVSERSLMFTETLLLPIIVAFLSTTMTSISSTTYSTPTFPVESAGVLLRHPTERKYLFLERNPDYIGNTNRKHELEYPGGKFEEADLDAHKCAERETWEEANLAVPVDQLHTGLTFKTYNPGSKKWVYLIETKLTQQQLDAIETINRKLNDDLASDPKSVTALSLRWVAENDLRQLVEGTISKFLPLRGFNRIVLRAYFSAK